MVFSREERIEQLKRCGQSIIENAEKLIAEHEYPISHRVVIDMPCREIPTIKSEQYFYPKEVIEKL